jgi:hypothetical protein
MGITLTWRSFEHIFSFLSRPYRVRQAHPAFRDLGSGADRDPFGFRFFGFGHCNFQHPSLKLALSLQVHAGRQRKGAAEAAVAAFKAMEVFFSSFFSCFLSPFRSEYYPGD